MIFIITMLLLAADFYYSKNIAGRRLVGLRWWNEVEPQTGDSKWVFESSEPGTKVINPTDSRFFWLAMYIQPVIWVLMAVVALFKLQFLWLPLVGELPSFLSFPVWRTWMVMRMGTCGRSWNRGWDEEMEGRCSWAIMMEDDLMMAIYLSWGDPKKEGQGAGYL